MTEDTQASEIPVETPKVDESAVRRRSVLSGMWAGVKKGLLWGGVAGVVATGLGTALAFTLGKGAAGLMVNATGNTLGALPWIFKIPYVGPFAATAIGGFMAFAGYNAVSAAANIGPAGLALGLLGTFATAAIPVMAITLGAGALIGGIAGAVSGYNDGDNKVAQAHRQAKAQVAQLAFEREQMHKAIMQEREMEAQLGNQTKELFSGNNQQIGQLSPNAPHSKLLEDSRLRGMES